MPRNTGRGSRSAAASTNQSSRTTMWTNRTGSTGRFVQAKTNGGTFKPVADKKTEPPHSRT